MTYPDDCAEKTTQLSTPPSSKWKTLAACVHMGKSVGGAPSYAAVALVLVNRRIRSYTYSLLRGRSPHAWGVDISAAAGGGMRRMDKV